jgi:hypothetical protein
MSRSRSLPWVLGVSILEAMAAMLPPAVARCPLIRQLPMRVRRRVRRYDEALTTMIAKRHITNTASAAGAANLRQLPQALSRHVTRHD